MKEINESAFGTGCAQMSEANISFISFISAGLKITPFSLGNLRIFLYLCNRRRTFQIIYGIM